MGAPSFQLTAPDGADVTDYDRAHVDTYLRLLDAEAARADWQAIACEVFTQDFEADPAAVQAMVLSHLARARWLRDGGFFRLLRE